MVSEVSLVIKSAVLFYRLPVWCSQQGFLMGTSEERSPACVPHQTPDLLQWSLANCVKSSVSAKLKGLGDFRKHAALFLSVLSAKRMIPFPMCRGTGSDLTAGDIADLLLGGEADAAFRKHAIFLYIYIYINIF